MFQELVSNITNVGVFTEVLVNGYPVFLLTAQSYLL